MDFLAAGQEFEAADRAWIAALGEALQHNHGNGSSPGFSLADAEPYLDALIARGDSTRALDVWRDLQALGVIPSQSADPANLITDSDFDHVPLNAGLDWRLDPRPYVAVSFPPAGTEAATHALRLDFNVARNEVDEPVYQFVPVVPGQSYALSASVRSEAIASDRAARACECSTPHAPRVSICRRKGPQGQPTGTPYKSISPRHPRLTSCGSRSSGRAAGRFPPRLRGASG